MIARYRKPFFASLVVLAFVALAALLLQREEPRVQARVLAGTSQADGFVRAERPVPLIFPADYGPHPDYQTEWWYYTGNLEAANGHRFGYQFTIFRRALVPPAQRQPRESDWAADQVYMGHFTLTDVANRSFQAFERFSRGAAGLAGAQAEPYRVWLEDWEVAEVPGQGPGITRVRAAAGEIAIDLQLADLKGPILRGDRGYSQKGPEPGNASYYYSLTRLQTTGTVQVGGQGWKISGISWKDHEYSTSALSENQVGWDWFALQLDDGSELQVYYGRQDDGSIDPFSAGDFIPANGDKIPLTPDEFAIETEDTWRSPHSGAIYPVRWRVSVPGLDIDLSVEAYLPDQELNVSVIYWEGAVHIEGTRAGQPVSGNGYVEMTGYAQKMNSRF